MPDDKKCLKCGGAAAEGFVLDRGHLNEKQEQIWVEGAPESSFWKGINISDRAIFNVRALRCTDCGFLEFYADQPIESKGALKELFGG